MEFIAVEHAGAIRRALLFTPLVIVLTTLDAFGQDATAPGTEECSTGPITQIFIDNHSIFDTSDPELDPRFGWAYRLANALHVRTRVKVIRRELLFEPGDCYSSVLADESERLLRANDFLAEVDIFGVPQEDGTWHVVVDTQDEWSTKVDLRLDFDNGIQFEGLRARETNLLGTGQTLGVYYVDRDVERDYGVSFATPQLFGTRWDFDTSLGKTRAGTAFGERLVYPFVGEVGRWAALHSFSRQDRFFDYIRQESGDVTHVLVPVREKAFEVALISRIGQRGNQALLGGALAFQELTYPGGSAGVRVVRGGRWEDAAPDSAAAALVAPQMHEINNIRVMLLVGQRNVWWVKRRGLDSMRGEQDVQLGGEVTLALGRSVPALERDDDFFGTLSVFTGLESGRFIVSSRGRADARRNIDALQSEWEDIFAEVDLLTYFRLPGQTLVARAAAAGAWHTRTPFQLTLGGDRAVRGFDDRSFPGGRRLVFTLEDRLYVGWPLPSVLDLGLTGFADVGRVWPGDAPFAEDSGWRAAVGLGLRGSLPPGGRGTYRLDIAFPIGAGSLTPRISFALDEVLGLIAEFDDPQVRRSRRPGAVGDLLGFRR